MNQRIKSPLYHIPIQILACFQIPIFLPCVKLPNKRLLNRISNPIDMFHRIPKQPLAKFHFQYSFPSNPNLIPCISMLPIPVPISIFNFPIFPNPISSQQKHTQEAKRTASYADLKTRWQIKTTMWRQLKTIKDGREISWWLWSRRNQHQPWFWRPRGRRWHEPRPLLDQQSCLPNQ